jgi:hypothetical protein
MTGRQTAADPATGGWCDEWKITDGDPKDGDGVAAVYSMGPEGGQQSIWFLGDVSLRNGTPVACFTEGYNLDMPPVKRLRSLTGAGTAEPGAWCIIERSLP